MTWHALPEPLAQDERATLEAELRSARQHQAAAYQRMQETQRELAVLMGRARDLLARIRASRTATTPTPEATPPSAAG